MDVDRGIFTHAPRSVSKDPPIHIHSQLHTCMNRALLEKFNMIFFSMITLTKKWITDLPRTDLGHR